MKTVVDLPVVGIHHRLTTSGRRMLADYIENHVDVKCRLEREPTNEFDKNAVKVIITSSPYRELRHIGYIDRTVAKTLAPLLDKGQVEIVEALLSDVEPYTGRATLVTLINPLDKPGKPAKKKSRKTP